MRYRGLQKKRVAPLAAGAPKPHMPPAREATARENEVKLTHHRVCSSMFGAIFTVGCTSTDITELWPDPKRPRPGPAEPQAVGRLQSVWNRALAQGVSAVALVRHQGRTLARFTAGMSDREQGVPNTMDTIFSIGSITKQFTGAAITRLHEEGRLALDAPLGSLFEGVPGDKAAITVHQLLTHTGGFAAALGDDDEPILRDAYLDRAWRFPLSAEPGALHWYSNTGYSILGAIIEGLTGRSYDAYLADELLRPAGLQDTGFLELQVDPSRIALGYAEGEVDDPFARPHASDGYYWNLRANGGLLSTADDLARWSDALFAHEVLSPEALDLYLTPHVREGLGSDAYYAYGWAVSDTAAGRLISHDGGNGFFFAEVRQYVDADLLVIVLSNEAIDAVYDLPVDLAHAVLPELPTSDELPEPPPLAVERFEELENGTASFAEQIEFTADRSRAVAGFFIELESGSARYRVLGPDGEVFRAGEARALQPVERLVVIPPRIGPWQLEINPDEATGSAYLAWAWD